jgi:hypothetical protein
LFNEAASSVGGGKVASRIFIDSAARRKFLEFSDRRDSMDSSGARPESDARADALAERSIGSEMGSSGGFSSAADDDGALGAYGQLFAAIERVICLVRSVSHMAIAADAIVPSPHRRCADFWHASSRSFCHAAIFCWSAAAHLGDAVRFSSMSCCSVRSAAS